MACQTRTVLAQCPGLAVQPIRFRVAASRRNAAERGGTAMARIYDKYLKLLRERY